MGPKDVPASAESDAGVGSKVTRRSVPLTDEDRGGMIDALLGARSVLSEPGVWCQNAQAKRPLVHRPYGDDPIMVGGRWSHPDAEQFCLLGAVCVTTRQNATGHPVHRYLASLLRQRFGWKATVPRWNDQPGRTVTEVLGLIDTALDDLKSGTHRSPDLTPEVTAFGSDAASGEAPH